MHRTNRLIWKRISHRTKELIVCIIGHSTHYCLKIETFDLFFTLARQAVDAERYITFVYYL